MTTCGYTLGFTFKIGLVCFETHLDEGLDLAPLGQLLRPHPLCHLQWVTLDTSDNGVRKWSLLGTLIILLDNDDLLSGLASLEDNGDLCDMVKGKTL